MRFDNNFWLFTKPIAHRGLWGKEIVENSLSAYKNAVKNAYPIEIDLYSSIDGEIFSFHDDSLKRMTNSDGFIYQKTAKELSNLKLIGCDQTIPTFNEVLELVDGKVPILIELKDQPNKNYVKTVVERLKSYKGQFAIQSFNPLLINKVKKLAPEFCRGILGTTKYSKHLPKIKRHIVRKMSLNFLVKPDFISYSFEDLPIKNNKNIPLITWTITSQKDYEKVKAFAKNVIFENFIPLEK